MSAWELIKEHCIAERPFATSFQYLTAYKTYFLPSTKSVISLGTCPSELRDGSKLVVMNMLLKAIFSLMMVKYQILFDYSWLNLKNRTNGKKNTKQIQSQRGLYIDQKCSSSTMSGQVIQRPMCMYLSNRLRTCKSNRPHTKYWSIFRRQHRTYRK